MRFKLASVACFVLVGCSSPDAVVEAGSADAAADATRAADSPADAPAVDAAPDAPPGCENVGTSCEWVSELSPKNPNCKPCMACHCCTELKDCFGSANDCKALFDCLKVCTSDAGSADGGAQACAQACLQDHQAGLTIANNGFAQCAQNKCASDCQ